MNKGIKKFCLVLAIFMVTAMFLVACGRNNQPYDPDDETNVVLNPSCDGSCIIEYNNRNMFLEFVGTDFFNGFILGTFVDATALSNRTFDYAWRWTGTPSTNVDFFDDVQYMLDEAGFEFGEVATYTAAGWEHMIDFYVQWRGTSVWFYNATCIEDTHAVSGILWYMDGELGFRHVAFSLSWCVAELCNHNDC